MIYIDQTVMYYTFYIWNKKTVIIYEIEINLYQYVIIKSRYK